MWVPQNFDQGMPVAARTKITTPAKAPVTFWLSAPAVFEPFSCF